MTRNLSILIPLLLGLAGCATRVESRDLEATLGSWGEAPEQTALEPGGAVADPQTSASSLFSLSLVFVPGEQETLPVREDPSIDAEVISELDRHTLDVPSTGRREQVHGITWIEVVTPAGAGWIDADYTTQFVPSEDFCAAPEIADYGLRELTEAFYYGDPDRFAVLLSSTHGLRIRYFRGGEAQRFSPEAAAAAMAGEQSVDWGVDPQTGEMLRGTFDERVGEELLRVLDAGDLSCNQLALGGASYSSDVPDAAANLNFVSVHLPATEEGGMDWVTWTIGFAFEEGRPSIATLDRYVWEG